MELPRVFLEEDRSDSHIAGISLDHKRLVGVSKGWLFGKQSLQLLEARWHSKVHYRGCLGHGCCGPFTVFNSLVMGWAISAKVGMNC